MSSLHIERQGFPILIKGSKFLPQIELGEVRDGAKKG